MMTRVWWGWLLFLLVGCGGDESPARFSYGTALGTPAEIHLTDVAATAGLDYTWTLPNIRPVSLLDDLTSGVAVLDYDADQWPDLLFSGTTAILYHNQGDGTFQRTDLIKLDPAWYQSVAVGDVDGDGDPDVYLSAYQGGVLLLNERGQAFRDVSAEWGVVAHPWGSGTAFLDLDSDGDLDLYVAGYLDYDMGANHVCGDREIVTICRPDVYAPLPPQVYQNTGGHFTLVEKGSGLESASGRNLGLLYQDLDGDGRGELLLANDNSPGDLLRYDGVKWENHGQEAGFAYGASGRVIYGMGVDSSDVNGDGHLDVAVGAFQREGTSLFMASPESGPLLFRDLAFKFGLGPLTIQYVTFGVKFVDLDQDGLEELLLANGHVVDEINKVEPQTHFAQPLQIFRVGNDKVMEETHALEGEAAQPRIYRALATLDYDRDGDLDVVVSVLEGPPRLLRNDTTSQGHWLQLKLRDTLGREVNGVYLTVEAGGVSRIIPLRREGSFHAIHELMAHVGLGNATRADRVTVVWPSGRREVFGPLAADQVIPIKEGTGKTLSPPR